MPFLCTESFSSFPACKASNTLQPIESQSGKLDRNCSNDMSGIVLSECVHFIQIAVHFNAKFQHLNGS